MAQQTPQRRTIALINQKGGVGKTTTAVNLGAALAELDRSVLLIDLDPQAHLTLHAGIDPTEMDATLYDLITEEQVSAYDLVQQVDERLAVIPSDVNLAGAESELVNRPDRQTILKRKLSPVLQAFDYVLVDCPPSLGLLTLNALAFVKEVIVPMQPQFLALQGLSKLLETVQLVRQRVNPALSVSGVILCIHEAQTNLATEIVNDLNDFFQAGRKLAMPWSHAVLFDPPIRRNIKLAECPSFGQTVFEYAPWCPGARDYRRLAESVNAGPPNGKSSEREARAEPDAGNQEANREVETPTEQWQDNRPSPRPAGIDR